MGSCLWRNFWLTHSFAHTLWKTLRESWPQMTNNGLSSTPTQKMGACRLKPIRDIQCRYTVKYTMQFLTVVIFHCLTTNKSAKPILLHSEVLFLSQVSPKCWLYCCDKVVDLELKPVLTGSPDCPAEAVHGSYLRNWRSIQQQGLSRMKRTHIHLASGLPGEDGVISGKIRMYLTEKSVEYLNT